jgi:hypothetical protein
MLTDDQITRLLSSYTRGRDLTDIFRDAYRLGLERGTVIGFGMTGEGYNAEYPYHDCGEKFEEESEWIEARDEAIRAAKGN